MNTDPAILISQRTSRRSYVNEVMEPEDILQIQVLLDKFSLGPLGNPCTFKLVSKHVKTNQKLKLGTYGFIKGARQFVVGQIIPSSTAMLDYGFLLEELIIELTQMQLGTCWLGGTFDRSEFSKAVNLQKGWVIPAITPVGFPTKSRSLGESIIRAGAGSRKRKNWEEMFFAGDSKEPVVSDQLEGKSQWLEMLRLAPSASNNQPWRILVYPDKFQLYLSRKPGYKKMFGAIDLQMVDMGIAMSHLDLMARKDKHETQWLKEKGAENLYDWEYVISLIF